MDLKSQEVAALLEYLEVESRRVEASQRYAGTGPGQSPDAASTSCCQKDKKPVLRAAEVTAASVGLVDGGEDQDGEGGVSTAFVNWSVGMGCFFLSLAAFTRRRSRPSVGGEQQARPSNGAGPAVPLSLSQEANR